MFVIVILITRHNQCAITVQYQLYMYLRENKR